MSAVERAIIVILFLTPFIGCDPAAASLEERVEKAALGDTLDMPAQLHPDGQDRRSEALILASSSLGLRAST